MRIRALLLVFVLVGAARVSAQPAEPRQGDDGFIGRDRLVLEVDDCRPPPPMTTEQLRQVGSEHYHRGEVLYAQGDYRGAVNELAASYCLIPFYTILKDIGQAYERELDYARAIAYFERYVSGIPKDAQRSGPCAPDPQDDRQNVLARISVLRDLPAKILVETQPDDAQIALSTNGVVEASGHSGQQLTVRGGPHVLTITRDGYHPVSREIHPEIGKPYTFFERLEPRTGKLKVRVIPGDARLFLDKRQVGTGDLDLDLARGRYTFEAEAPGRLKVTREVEVLSERDTDLVLELPLEPQFGRRQLLAYGGVAGATSGALLASASGDGLYGVMGAAGGAAAGLLATYYGARDVPLGTSSLTITSSLIGGVAGGSLGFVASGRADVVAPMIGGGLVLGSAVGYYAGDRLKVRPGDAAIINSGGLWGTVAGAFFIGSFHPGDRVGGGIMLSGLAMGTVAGVMLTRNFSVSRGRAALIDVGGVVGVFTGIAAASVVTTSSSSMPSADQQNERNAHFALAGLGVGLILAGVLTRHMDEPTLAVQPVLGRATASNGSSTTTFGIGGSF